ncbi:hypothetical protein LWI28_006703 [Acer negundo]|uniref:Transmembrane protein n=1 Tax=Acer negundo TaxID=4023 RepID=A0AAD5J3D5_ACENE|nr:hypothetical protein LWI28_006703 [Acer negundo]KAK4849934.1 hypothetical protein QYF36_002187 [Acer negundo]
MASLEGADALNGSTGETFPAADIAGELNPGMNKNFEVDPTSSDISTSLQIKKQLEETKNKKKREEKDATQKLKSAIIVSAVVAAVAGAVFALTKKLRENK